MNKNIGDGVAFDGSITDCDVCAMRKSYQLAHPKKSNHAAINAPCQLVYADLMGPFKPTSLSARSPTSSYKWTAVYLLCSKDQPFASLQLFVTSIVILLGKRVIRWLAGKRGEFVGDEFKD